jgi:hypothetical protein
MLDSVIAMHHARQLEAAEVRKRMALPPPHLTYSLPVTLEMPHRDKKNDVDPSAGPGFERCPGQGCPAPNGGTSTRPLVITPTSLNSFPSGPVKHNSTEATATPSLQG